MLTGAEALMFSVGHGNAKDQDAILVAQRQLVSCKRRLLAQELVPGTVGPVHETFAQCLGRKNW
jgi:hypothetical protein